MTYLWGHVLYKQGNYEQAEPKFQNLIDRFPDSLFVENAWYAIGLLNYKLERYEKAYHAFKTLLGKFPESEFRGDARRLIQEIIGKQTQPQKDIDNP